MANPYIIYDNISNYSCSGSEAANSSYPLTNLNDYERDTIWQSNTTVQNQTLLIDMGSSYTANALAVLNHNWDELGMDIGITFAGSQDNSTYTTLINAGVFDYTNDPIIQTFTLSGYRYYRFIFNSTGALSTPPNAGLIIISNALTFETPYEWKYRINDREYATSRYVSRDGTIRKVQRSGGRRKYAISFRYQSDSIATAFKEFQQTVQGKALPFFFVDTDSTGYYVYFDEDMSPVKAVFTGRNDISLRMKDKYTI